MNNLGFSGVDAIIQGQSSGWGKRPQIKPYETPMFGAVGHVEEKCFMPFLLCTEFSVPQNRAQNVTEYTVFIFWNVVFSGMQKLIDRYLLLARPLFLHPHNNLHQIIYNNLFKHW